MKVRVRIGKRGTLVIPKDIRERLGIEEGSVLFMEVKDHEIVLRKDDLWDRFWGCAKGLMTPEDIEREFDEAEED
ncbi:MAG: AbrB family transcriptional regulator [Thermoprotei archaeon]|nr:MAG: AbrB family transcriptional regulator [Thermoprotei archaeon]